MSSEYSVEPYSAEHRGAVLGLHRRLMPRRQGDNERYFAWKYEENPYLDTPHMALVFSGSKLVAMRGLYGTRWIDPSGGAETIPAAEDLFVDEQHRNRGLFLMIDKELRRIALELDSGSIVSLSGAPATQRLQTVAGWVEVQSLHRVYRAASRPLYPLRSRPLLRRAAGRARRVRSRLGFGLVERPSEGDADRVLDGLANTSSSVQVSSEPDLSSMVALSAAPSSSLRQERSEAFYRWRLQNPDRRYRFVYWRDPVCLGFLVLALLPRDPQRVKIVASGAETADVMLELLGALSAARRASYELLPKMVPDAVGHELTQLGFHPAGDDRREQQLTLFAKSTSRDLPAVAKRDEPWHVDLIDTMRG